MTKIMQDREELYQHLEKKSKVLKSPRLKAAFSKIDRADFVDEDYKCEAYEDYPLPIGFNQTISQPTTVAFMLELLSPVAGNKVLDVGSGSGWSSALLGEIVTKTGKVVGVEIIPELVKKSLSNLSKYDLPQVQIIETSSKLGFEAESPYDRILVSAASLKIPGELLKQLGNNGVMAIPIKDSIFMIKKTAKGEILREEFPGFRFVPLIY